jgi:uncharacterized protein (DUF1330 family)
VKELPFQPCWLNRGKKALARSANVTEIEGIPPERAVILEFASMGGQLRMQTIVRTIK